MENKKKEFKKVMTPMFRVSFPQVFKPKAFGNQEPKYSLTMLFDKESADLSDLKKAAIACAKEKWGEKDKWPKKLQMPFSDGDEKADLEGYAGMIVVRATAKQKPGLVDKDLDPIIDESIFYAGCYARATLSVFAYDVQGNKGVSFGLQNIQKLKDGEAFSGRKDATKEFDAFKDDSDDSSNYENDDDYDLGI